MPTTNPVPSTDPSDLLFNAGKLDEAVNSSANTYTDRLGVTRMTVAGAVNAMASDVGAVESAKNTGLSDIASDVSAVESRKNTAINTEIPAAVALVDTAVAQTAAGSATAAKVAAESARDAALIQAGVYVDEPTGRAAVANGVAFKVQGSGDVAAYEYRRVNATTVSTLIATYPAKAAYDSLKTIVGNGPKTGTFSATLTFDDDEIVDSYLQTAAINFTLAASGHKLGVSKRITVIGNGSGISFGFTVGIQQGTISAAKVNTIYIVYVGNSTVDLHIVNSDTVLTDTANLLALVQADSASKLTLSGSNVIAMLDQSPVASNFAVVGTMPYDATGKFITPTGARFSMTARAANDAAFTFVLAARFLAQAGDLKYIGSGTGGESQQAGMQNGFVDNMFGRGIFQTYTDAMTKLCGDSVLIVTGDAASYNVYLNDVKVAEKLTGKYSGFSEIKAILTQGESQNIAVANRLYEFRLLNKAYFDRTLLTQVYNDVRTRYSLDPTVFPTASGLTHTGTPVAGGTVTAAWIYVQGAAGPAGRYCIEWRWAVAAGTYWFYMFSPGGKTAINNPVSPALTAGKYWRYRITIQDDQGRCSKVGYESPDIYVPA